MMVMDGTSSSAVALTRLYKGGPLSLDEVLVGGVRTRSLYSAITDSAAAGTALATGHKTVHEVVGMVPGAEERSLVPAVNLVEAARSAGLATGLVATSEIQNATPASYSSHARHRSEYGDIAEQQVFQGLDVVLGGGMSSLVARNRSDREDLVPVLAELGYRVVRNRSELAKVVGDGVGGSGGGAGGSGGGAGPGSGGVGGSGSGLGSGADGAGTAVARDVKVWGSFAEYGMSNHFDRESLTPEQPTLAEMTEAAIGLLARKERGFFLMVEGSKVDWAAHKNDPVGMVSEVLGFDEAVRSALDFARKDGNTLVLAVTDHGNSGLSIGSGATDKTYMKSEPDLFVGPLKRAGLTLEGALATLDEDRGNLRDVAVRYGLKDLTRDEWRSLERARDDVKELERGMTRMMAKRSRLGFTTHGHTGEDVFLYGFGPGKPSGLLDNTELAGVIAGQLGFSFGADDGSGGKGRGLRYVAAKEHFAKGVLTIRGARSADPVLEVKLPSGETLVFPENRNYFFRNGVKEMVPAPNVFDGKEWFVAVVDE
nr:alkaline phosphatase [Bacillus sp. DNRA2]